MLCLQKNRLVNRKLELKKKNCLRWSLHCLFTIAPPIIEAEVIHIWSTAFIHRAFPEIFSAAHQLWKEQTPRRYLHSVTTYPSLNEARAEPLAVDSGLTIIADVRGRQWLLPTGVSYIRLSAKAIKVILFVIIASYHWPGMVRLHYKKNHCNYIVIHRLRVCKHTTACTLHARTEIEAFKLFSIEFFIEFGWLLLRICYIKLCVCVQISQKLGKRANLEILSNKID